VGFTAMPGVIAGVVAVIWTMGRRRDMRWTLFISATAGLLTLFVTSTAFSDWQSPQDVPAISLFSRDGSRKALQFHDGKPMVVNLWATWCGPCRDEMPTLAMMQKAHPEIDLVFVNQGESSDAVEAFLKELDLHIVNALSDPGLDVARATGVTAYPTTLFYDASGHLVEKHLGRLSPATFQATLEHLNTPSSVHSIQR
jgi:thiol-disulfide isomerase/thioredoxin